MPTQLICNTTWAEWVDEDEEDFRLVDWGEAFEHGKEPACLAQPRDLKAPEIILTGHFDHRIDLWRAGCIVSLHLKQTLLLVMLTALQIYTLIFAARPFQY